MRERGWPAAAESRGELQPLRGGRHLAGGQPPLREQVRLYAVNIFSDVLNSFCLQTVADQADAGGFPVSGPAAAHLRVGPEVQQAAHHQADREHGAPRQGEQSGPVGS